MAQSINIKIAGRPYNLTATSPEHEEVIRKAAEDVNRKIAQYQEKFPKTGMSDIMAFMALNVCMNNIVLQKQISQMNAETETLAGELESYLDTIDKK